MPYFPVWHFEDSEKDAELDNFFINQLKAFGFLQVSQHSVQ